MKHPTTKAQTNHFASPDGWPGLVYFIGSNDKSPVKVGYTNDNTHNSVNKRLSALQTGNPETLRVISTIEPAYIKNEKAIHSFLAPWRVRDNGEWFENNAVSSLIEIFNHQWPDNFCSSTPPIEEYKFYPDAINTTEPEKEFIRLFIENQAITIFNLKSVPKLPLLGWLHLQKDRNDPVGDLSRDSLKSPSPFLEIDTLIGYSDKLPEHTWQALASAFYECYWDAKAIGHCLNQNEKFPWELRHGAQSTL